MAETDSPEFIEAVEQFFASEFNITVDLGQMSFEEQEEWLDSQSQRVQDAFETFVSLPTEEELSDLGDAPHPGMLAFEAAMAVPGFRTARTGIGLAARAGRAALGRLGAARSVGSRAITATPGLRRILPANRLQRTVRYDANFKPTGGSITDPLGIKPSGTMTRRAQERAAARMRIREQPGRARVGGGVGVPMVHGRFSRSAELGMFGAANALLALGGIHPDVIPDWMQGEEDAPEETTEEPMFTDAEGTAATDEDMNRFYWDGHTMESAGDKWVNFMLGNGAGVIDWDSYASLQDFIARTPSVNQINLRSEDGQAQLAELLIANWDQVPAFKEQMAEAAFRRMNLDTGFTPYEIGGTNEPATPEEMDVIKSLLHDTNRWGVTLPEGAEYIFAGFIGEEAARYANEYSRTTPHMMQWGTADDDMTFSIGGFNELSYDGTPGGSIHTLRDAFSGDPNIVFGPNFVTPYLRDLESRTKQPGQGSPIIAQIQQTLYSMGYMRDEQGYGIAPAQWGYLDDATIEGMKSLQWNMIENYTVASDMGMNTDMHLLYRELANESIREIQSMSRVDDSKQRETQVRNDVINEARTGIVQALADRGVSIKSGSDVYLDAVNEVMDNLTSAEQEVLTGEGGDAGDVTAAEQVLKEFYGGSDDWADHIEFGHTTNDSNMFINYAQKVGAISDQEMNDLRDYTYSPDHMARLRARHGKDVAVANFLMDFEGKPMSGMSRDDVHNALVVYANTIGQGYAGRNGFDPATLRDMADRAYSNLSFEPAAGVEQLLDKQEDRVAKSMKISERGRGQMNYSRLLDVIDSVGAPRTNRARF